MENKIVVALKGIIVRDGRALIVKRSQNDKTGAGTWEFPGGKIEFGEALEEALKREIREETGLSVQVESLLYATEFQTHDWRQVIVMTYFCKTALSQVRLSTEHTDYQWAGEEELRERLYPPILHDMEKNHVMERIALTK